MRSAPAAVPAAAPVLSEPPRDARWHAQLTLDYRRDGKRTIVASTHTGPLRVLKPLYPEGDALCQSIVVHPPGGIAGGDALALGVRVPSEASAQITTPGAAKWYKANGRTASQDIALRVDGALEWLPQEAIVFDQAQVRSTLTMHVAPQARVLGWDIVALGRTAAGEAFGTGRFVQSIRFAEITPRGAHLHWLERTRIDGDDALLHSPIGLAGAPVFGCLWAWGPTWDAPTLEDLRARLGDDAAPVTVLAPQMLVARTRAATTAQARATLERLWRTLRPLVIGRAALAPRIWAT